MRGFDWVEIGDIGQAYSRDNEYCQGVISKAKYGHKIFSNARPDLFRWWEGSKTAEALSPFTGWSQFDRNAISQSQAPSFNNHDWLTQYRNLRAQGYSVPQGWNELVDFFGSEEKIIHPYEIGITKPSNWYVLFLEMNMCSAQWQNLWTDYMSAQLNERKYLDGITVSAPKVQWYEHRAYFPKGKLPDGSPAGSFISLLSEWIPSGKWDSGSNFPYFPAGSIWDFPKGCNSLVEMLEASGKMAALLNKKTNKTVMWMPFNLTVGTWTNPSYRALLISEIQTRDNVTAEQAKETLYNLIQTYSDKADMVWMNPFDPAYDKSLEWYNSLSHGNRIQHSYPQ